MVISSTLMAMGLFLLPPSTIVPHPKIAAAELTH